MFLALRERKEDEAETGWEGGGQEDRTGSKTAWSAYITCQIIQNYNKYQWDGWVAEWLMAPVLKFGSENFLRHPIYPQRLRNTDFFAMCIDFVSLTASSKI